MASNYFATIVAKSTITGLSSVSAALGDQIALADASDSDNLKRATIQTIIDLAEEASGPPGVYSAAAEGIDPANAAAVNTTALQAAIDMISTAGGGVLMFDAGTYLFAYTGTSPYNAANRYCVELKSNVILQGREGTVLKLANAQQTGTTNGVHMFVAGTACTNYGFRDIELDGNAAGQTGWTGGYSQGGVNGCLLYAGISSGGAGSATTNAILDNVYAHSCLSNPFNLLDVTGGIFKDIRVQNCGEGMQFARSFNCHTFGYHYSDPLAVSVGDGWESSDGSDVSLINFHIENSLGGSAIDMATPHFRIANGIIQDGGDGIVIQCVAAAIDEPNPTGICSDVRVYNMTADGCAVAMNPETPAGHVTVSNVVCNDCNRGFVAVNQTGSALANGNMEFLNCVARGCAAQGFYGTLAKITIIGGEFSNNGDVGILLNPVGNAASTDTVYTISGAVCKDNVGYGIQVAFNAAFAPIVNIAALCDGNATGLTFQHQYAEMWTHYPTSTTMQMRNLRPYRKNAASSDILYLTGESTVVHNTDLFKQIDGGLDGQIITLITSTNSLNLRDDAAGGGNLNLLGSVDRLCQANYTTTLQYSAATQKWNEIARNAVEDGTYLAAIGGAAATGTGGLVRATSPTLVTPLLGIPTSGTLTNCTGLPAAGVVGTAAILGANTYTRLQTITQGTANEGILASTGYSLTGSDATPMLSFAGTWNTSGTPTLLDFDVTDTASNAASIFLNLRRGGTSRFKVFKHGGFTCTTDLFAFTVDSSGSLTTPGGIAYDGSGSWYSVTAGGFSVASSAGFKFFNANVFGTEESAFKRTGTRTVGLLQSTNAQKLQVYGSADGTPGSNYIAAALSCSSTAVTLGVDALGTFANADININSVGTGGICLQNATSANGQKFCVKSLTELLTIAAAATSTTTIQKPANSIILSVSVRVTVAVTCTSVFEVGDAGSANRFNTASVSKAANSTDSGTKAGAYYNATAQGIVITPDTVPSDATGRVRVTIHYIEVTPPTS